MSLSGNFVIKGINLEGLRKVGDPIETALNYYKNGIDEIIFIDSVASLYQRNNLYHIIEESVKDIFVPLTIGGGIRSLKDIEMALKAGADKVAINSYATENPNFIKEAVNNFGSSCIISYIEAKEVQFFLEGCSVDFPETVDKCVTCIAIVDTQPELCGGAIDHCPASDNACTPLCEKVMNLDPTAPYFVCTMQWLEAYNINVQKECPQGPQSVIQCIDCIAIIALQSLHCNHCIAIIALHSLQCSHCNEMNAMQ